MFCKIIKFEVPVIVNEQRRLVCPAEGTFDMYRSNR